MVKHKYFKNESKIVIYRGNLVTSNSRFTSIKVSGFDESTALAKDNAKPRKKRYRFNPKNKWNKCIEVYYTKDN